MSEMNRYTMRFRDASGFNRDVELPLDICGRADDLGVWDTVERRFVKRNENGQWVPES